MLIITITYIANKTLIASTVFTMCQRKVVKVKIACGNGTFNVFIYYAPKTKNYISRQNMTLRLT